MSFMVSKKLHLTIMSPDRGHYGQVSEHYFELHLRLQISTSGDDRLSPGEPPASLPPTPYKNCMSSNFSFAHFVVRFKMLAMSLYPVSSEVRLSLKNLYNDDI